MENVRGPVLDKSLRRGLASIALAGGSIAVGGGIFWGPRVAISIVIGTAVACLNLVVIARVIRELLGEGSRFWLLVGLVKMAALFGGVGWLFHANVVGALPFVVGYASLPLGLVFAQAPVTEGNDP